MTDVAELVRAERDQYRAHGLCDPCALQCIKFATDIEPRWFVPPPCSRCAFVMSTFPVGAFNAWRILRPLKVSVPARATSNRPHRIQV